MEGRRGKTEKGKTGREEFVEGYHHADQRKRINRAV
jgi:hypothetical protein